MLMDEQGSELNGKPEMEVALYQHSPQDLKPEATAVPPVGPDGYITWSASEFIMHQKGWLWYVLLSVCTLAISTIVYLITKDEMTTGVLVVVGVLLGTIAARKPLELDYRLDATGLTVGNRQYPYVNYRSFAVLEEGAFSKLMLVPFKRFGLSVTVYYHPADENKIVDIVAKHLPLEERKKDLLDRMLWRLKI